MTRRRRAALVAAVTVVAAASAAAALGGSNDSGFKTSQPAMLDCPSCTEVTPILTVGDTLPGGYRYEAIPDGISVRARGEGRADLYVNHETSTVPFPFTFPGSTNAAVAANDFDNAQVSHLILNQHSAGALHGDYAISSAEGFQRDRKSVV